MDINHIKNHFKNVKKYYVDYNKQLLFYIHTGKTLFYTTKYTQIIRENNHNNKKDQYKRKSTVH